MQPFNPPRVGEINISGRGPTRVAVVAYNKLHYLIGALPGDRFKLIGGTRQISGRETARVPKRCIRLTDHAFPGVSTHD